MDFLFVSSSNSPQSHAMMPRDMDLIRELMLRFERDDTTLPDGKSMEEVAYHVKLLIDEGFLTGSVSLRPSPAIMKPYHYIVSGITWKGHDFIDHIRSDTAWGQAKEYFKSHAVGFTIDLILEFFLKNGRAVISGNG